MTILIIQVTHKKTRYDIIQSHLVRAIYAIPVPDLGLCVKIHKAAIH